MVPIFLMLLVLSQTLQVTRTSRPGCRHPARWPRHPRPWRRAESAAMAIPIVAW
ncbi:MAG: hypothetical protein IPI84_05625 [Holophagaceae bacterium]|nr:hypothetical protein [Holophagaceae bacterium]